DVSLGLLARGEDDQVLSRAEYRLGRGGEGPLVEVVGPVGEVPAGESDGLAGGIEDLDPVSRIVIAVEERAAMRRHQLCHGGGGATDAAGLERLKEPTVAGLGAWRHLSSLKCEREWANHRPEASHRAAPPSVVEQIMNCRDIGRASLSITGAGRF